MTDKEFLQWCGIQCYYKDEVNDGIEAWICPPDGEKTIAFYGLTLEFLFQYAVPKVIDVIMAQHECSSDVAYAILFQKWLQELELNIPRHADTLKVAIGKILEVKK